MPAPPFEDLIVEGCPMPVRHQAHLVTANHLMLELSHQVPTQHHTMRFGRSAKALAKRMLSYYRIS